MTTIPGRLSVGKDGRITGPATITYNTPWPLKFAKAGVTGQMRGALLHTVDGSYEACINVFNGASPGGSAHFVIAQDGRIHQFVPLGRGYETYHAYAANQAWYGIETEDQGNLEHHAHVVPISEAGLWAWAQLFELLSRYAGFPLQVTDNCNGRGLAYHRMCHDWNLNGHTYPGASMTDVVRVNQRAEIVHRAGLIRNAARPQRTPGHVDYAAWGDYLAWGDMDGQPIPFWAQLTDQERAAREAGAAAARAIPGGM